MSMVTKGISMFILAVSILLLLVMIVLGFMLGFDHPLPWVLIFVLVIIPFIHDKIIAKRFIKWKDAYSVGIQSIDKDHKKLLGMINQLQTAVHYTTDDAMIDIILDDLLDYTKYHFSREEDMLQKFNYPDFEQHKHQHETMIAQITKHIENYRSSSSHNMNELTQYLKSWLINHINGCDQEYAPLLRGKVE